MPLQYRQVKDVYDNLKDAGVVKTSLPEWSAEMNRLTDSDLYGAGLHDNFIKRTSVAIDRLLEKTGLPEVTQEVGRAAGEVVGAPDVGASIGKGLPRMTANFLPLTVAAATAPASALAAGGALGLSALLSGAETYTETGSPAAGVLSGATAAVLPGAAGAAERLALRGVGARLVEGPIDEVGNAVSKFFPTAGQNIVAKTAGQAAAAGVLQASEFGQQAIAGEPLDTHPVDLLLNMTLGAAPFALAHLGGRAIKSVRGVKETINADTLQHQVDVSNKAIEDRQARDKVAQENPIESLPDQNQNDASPEVIAETQQLIGKLRGEQSAVKTNPDLTPEERVKMVDALVQQEASLPKVPTGNTILGDHPDSSDRTQIIGYQLRDRPNSRTIHIADVPANPPELRGRVINYSKGTKEPAPIVRSDGTTVFGMSSLQWRTDFGTIDEWKNHNPRPRVDPTQPPLPEQAKVMSDEELHAHMAELVKVNTEVEAAATPGELQSAVVRLNHVEDANGLPLTNDAVLKKAVERLAKTDSVPTESLVKTAVKSTVAKVSRRVQERNAPLPTPREAAEVSAKMGEGGYSVFTQDKLSHAQDESIETQPIADFVTDNAIRIVRRNPEAVSRFNDWEGKDDTTFAKDVADFVDLVGQYGNHLQDVNPTDAAKFLNDRSGTVTWDEGEVKAFLERPHVKIWNSELDRGITRTRKNNALPARPALPAGNSWLFSMGPYDSTTNTLNLKHKLPKDGNLVVEQFRNMAGVGKPLASAEVDLYKQLVPEAFHEGKVNVPKLVEGLKTKGPVVETKKLGDPASEETQMMSEAQHIVDTAGYEVTTEMVGDVVVMKNNEIVDQEEIEALPREVQDAIDLIGQRTYDRINREGDAARYPMIAPKPESDMPGYVEGLVRVPVGDKTKIPQGGSQEDAIRRMNENERSLYRGPHFGSEDTNVLAFYRGYEENLPDGSKAFHVIEVQKDYKKGQFEHALANEKIWETLALKAAIQHAKEVGATKVIVSDAETAMMTEGHDRNIDPNGEEFFVTNRHEAPGILRFEQNPEDFFATKEGAQAVADFYNKDRAADVKPFRVEQNPNSKGPTQEKGMRLHYDQTLPSAMKALTGSPGENVELGMHKGALQGTETEGYGNRAQAEARRLEIMQAEPGAHVEIREHGMGYDIYVGTPKGSPVFKDAAGNPKTQITGRSYDISNTPDAFTLTDANRIGPKETPFVPQTSSHEAIVNGIGDTGHTANNYLHNSPDTFFQALSADLAKFTDSLGMIKVSFADTVSGGSYAQYKGNGESHVVISPADFWRIDYTLAHELVHGLSHAELYNPTNAKIARGLDDLRSRLIDALPSEQRARVRVLIGSKWIERYTTGQVTDPERDLSPTLNSAEANINYALLDAHEFLSQGLSNDSFRDFMRAVKTGTKETWFSRFSNIVKELLHLGNKIDGTAFEEFLSKADQLLDRGNFVASFSDFSNRYFENLGMTKEEARFKRTQALTIISSSPKRASDIINELESSVGYTDLPSREAFHAVTEMFRAKDENHAATVKLLEELGHRPDTSGVDKLSYEAIVGMVPHDVLDLLPEPVANFIFTKVQDISDVLGVLNAATDERNKGLLNIADPLLLHGPLKDAARMIDLVNARRDDRTMGRQAIDQMSAIAPDSFLIRHVLAQPDPGQEETAKAFSRESITKPKQGLAYWMEPLAQLVRRDKRAAEIAVKGFTLEPNARQFLSNSTRVLGVDLKSGSPEINKKTVKAAIKTISTSRLEKAVNRWMYQNNEQARLEKRGVTMLQTEHPEVAKVLQGLKPEDREGVIDTATKTSIITQATHQQILSHVAKISSTDGGLVAMQDSTTTKPEVAVEMAGRVMNALLVDRTDPQATQLADAELNLVQQKMTPEGFLSLYKFMQGEAVKHQAYKEYFTANPAWATAQRQEKFLVSFTRGGEAKELQASSIKEAKVLAQGGRDLVIEDNHKGRDDEMPVLGPDAPALIARIREIQATQDAVAKGLMTPENFEEYKKYTVATQFARETAATGGAPKFEAPPRLLSKGAEELPWLWNHISWAQRQSNYWTRQLFRAQSRLYLSSPEITADPELQKRLQQHVDNTLNPDPRLAQRVSRIASVWFMGFAPASAMINGLQTVSTLLPELINISGSPLKSYRLWKNAVSEVSGHLVKGGGKLWKDPEVDSFMRAAEKSGQVGFSMWDETAQTHETIANDWQRAMMKNKPQDTWQRLASVGGSYSAAAMWMFKSVESFNQRVALVASYKLHREMGLSVEESTKQAFEVNLAVNYGGGKAGRSAGLFSGADQFTRGAAMLATNMQNYNIGVVSQLSRYLQAGFFRPEGLKPSQVYAARLAATQMLGTQMAAAGLLGMPFVSGMLAVLNQAFPGLEVNKNLREFVSKIFGADEENGSVLSDAALTGLPSMLGWDMQSRLSWGNITPGVSEFNGFQPQLMLGPPANLVSNFVNGALKVVQGDPVGAEAFIPPGLKKLTQLASSGGVVKDYRNRPLFTPTAGETAGIALGFQPKRLSDFNAANRMSLLTQTNARNREGQFHQTQAEEVLKGNFGSVRQELLSRMQAEPNYDVRAGVRAIASSAEDLTFPRDPRREGTQNTGTDRTRLLSSFNLPPSGGSEVDRVRFRRQIQQRLGVQPQDQSAEMVARLVDRLRAERPDAVRSDLVREAQQALRGRHQTSALLPELQQ